MRYLGLVLIALAIPCARVAAQDAQNAKADPFVGTWKLDAAKSKFNPGPPLKDETVTIAPDKVTVDETLADGKTENWSYTPSPGSAATITGLENSTVTEKKVNERTIEHSWKMGTSTMQGRGVVSKNGKKMTYTLTGTNQEGKPLHNVLIFEKQ